MPLFEKAHVDHEKHLCSMISAGATLADYRKLVMNPKYLCRNCGRVAAKAENLCDPVAL